MRNIVRYKNRKLYDRDQSRYVTTTELLKEPTGSFVITNNETKEDVTLEVLFNALSTEQPAETKVRVMKYLTGVLENAAVTPQTQE